MLDSISIADAVRALAYARELDPGLVCNCCGLCWNPLRLRRFGDQACPQCGDLYPGFNYEP